MPVKIKTEPIKNLNEFKGFIEKRGLEFIGMSVSGKMRPDTRWISGSSDTEMSGIMIKTFDSIDYDYNIYSGKIDENFYLAAEIKS